MLSPEDNDLLSRVGPGTPMGKLTQVDAIGIMEMVFAGKIDRINLAGPINDVGIAISQTAAAKHSIRSPLISRNAGKITDNGGGQEDAMSDNKAIVPLDVSKIKNWKNLIPEYKEGNVAANTIRNRKGEIVGVPYISNADSMAYNKTKVGGDIDTWDALFDSQFKGYAAMQNDSGPTLTTTAVYLKESGKQDIVNPSDMSKSEVKGVCQFLIDQKKKGQFRTFWDGFGNGVDLLASEEVLVSSCWEPIAVIAAKKGADIHYGTMKEGHQTWNNVWMLTKGGKQRGQEDNFYKLMDLYLSPWFGARTLANLGFTPQMTGVNEYVEANPADFDANKKAVIAQRLKNKADRMAVKGNSWQNLYPKELRAYQDWWAKVQAA